MRNIPTHKEKIVKLQVVNVSTPVGAKGNVTFQEYDDSNLESPVAGGTSLNLVIDISEASNYIGGTVYTLDLKKVTSNAS